VYIDKGMTNKQEIRFSGEGDQAPNIIPGDVVIILEEKPHPQFVRKGSDLFYKANIDLLTSLAGGSFYSQHLDERILHVTILPGEVIRPDDIKQITGEGMPQYKRPFEKGNLIIQFEIEFPPSNWTSLDVIKRLETILPPRMNQNAPVGAMVVDDMVLSHVDPRRSQSSTQPQQQHSRRGNAYDEDTEDNNNSHHPGVQCAQQ